MKNIQLKIAILLSVFMGFFLTSCEKNDTLNDNVFIGEMAPQVYWEINSSTVNAGSEVPFFVQYYTSGKEPIDHLEVWYSVEEEESKTVSCPWTQTFTFQLSSTTSDNKRISQKISEYPHKESYWNDSLHAYSFNASFPTSSTLSSISWIKPATFDSTKMIKYFGEGFMQHFKDSLYTKMKALDFQKMYSGLNLVENFKVYLDSTFNENSGSYDYHFPKDSLGNEVIPIEIRNIYLTIPFADLIYNASNNNYDVEFSRSYQLNALIKAIDRKGTAGLSTKSIITLN